jgi:hypothetical protein
MDDCCDNCVEGIEPCCDEIQTEGVTTDIETLASHLCCQNRFHYIYDVMHGLTKQELIDLRDTLKTYTPTNALHPHLNAVFEEMIKNA